MVAWECKSARANDACVQLGILPTDTYPALVCDIEARKAVERLYTAKGMEPTKQLSILVRNFSDINTYTLGFPTTGMGQDTFRLARRALPGPVRPLLHAPFFILAVSILASY